MAGAAERVGITRSLVEEVNQDFLYRAWFGTHHMQTAIQPNIVLRVRRGGLDDWHIDYRCESPPEGWIAEPWRPWFRCRNKDAAVAKAVECFLKEQCKRFDVED